MATSLSPYCVAVGFAKRVSSWQFDTLEDARHFYEKVLKWERGDFQGAALLHENRVRVFFRC